MQEANLGFTFLGFPRADRTVNALW